MEPISLDVTSNPRLFLILLDPKFFQTVLDYSRPMSYDFPVTCPFSLVID